MTVSLQPNTMNGRTPLMQAAFYACDETVSSLLSWGANPDQTYANGNTALMFAIQSNCLTTINLLAPVTNRNLGGALYFLARFKIELVTGELKNLIGRAAQDRTPRFLIFFAQKIPHLPAFGI